MKRLSELVNLIPQTPESRLLPENPVNGDIPCFDATATVGGGNDVNTRILLHFDADEIKDEAAGNAAPVTITKKTGTITVVEGGKWGKCAKYVTGSMTVATNLDELNANNWVVSGWFNPDENDHGVSYPTWLSMDDQNTHGFGFDSTGRYGESDGPLFYLDTPPASGTWHWLAIVKYSGGLRFYLNGAFLNEISAQQRANFCSTLAIGGFAGTYAAGSTERTFSGLVDEVRLQYIPGDEIAQWTGTSIAVPDAPYSKPQTVGEWGKFNKAQLVRSVNGQTPDGNGNVVIEISGSIDLSNYYTSGNINLSADGGAEIRALGSAITVSGSTIDVTLADAILSLSLNNNLPNTAGGFVIVPDNGKLPTSILPESTGENVDLSNYEGNVKITSADGTGTNIFTHTPNTTEFQNTVQEYSADYKFHFQELIFQLNKESSSESFKIDHTNGVQISSTVGLKYNGAALNTANGLVQLGSDGKIPSNLYNAGSGGSTEQDSKVERLVIQRPASDKELYPILIASQTADFNSTSKIDPRTTSADKSRIQVFNGNIWIDFPSEGGLGTPFDNMEVGFNMSNFTYTEPYYVKYAWVTTDGVESNYKGGLFPASSIVPSIIEGEISTPSESSWHTLTDASTIALEVANGELQKVVLTQNCTLTAPTLDATNSTLLLQIEAGTEVTVIVSETEVISSKSGTWQIGWYWDGTTTRRYPVVEVL